MNGYQSSGPMGPGCPPPNINVTKNQESYPTDEWGARDDRIGNDSYFEGGTEENWYGEYEDGYMAQTRMTKDITLGGCI